MRLVLSTSVVFLIAVAAGSLYAQAQEPPSPGPPDVAQQPPRRGPPMLQPPGDRSPYDRDPTQPSAPLREAIDASQMTPQTGGASLPAIPRFSIKARVVGPSAPPMALISVDEKATIAVQAGREYPVPQAAGAGYRVKVRDITTAGIELELLPVNVRLTLQ